MRGCARPTAGSSWVEPCAERPLGRHRGRGRDRRTGHRAPIAGGVPRPATHPRREGVGARDPPDRPQQWRPPCRPVLRPRLAQSAALSRGQGRTRDLSRHATLFEHSATRGSGGSPAATSGPASPNWGGTGGSRRSSQTSVDTSRRSAQRTCDPRRPASALRPFQPTGSSSTTSCSAGEAGSSTCATPPRRQRRARWPSAGGSRGWCSNAWQDDGSFPGHAEGPVRCRTGPSVMGRG